MALVYEIIKDAFREANLIPITQSPTLDEQTEALRLLNRFVRSIFGAEAGEVLRSVAVGTNNVNTVSPVTSYDFTYPNYVPLNLRLVVNNLAPMTVQLHPDPEDGARLVVVDATGNFSSAVFTLDGNGRNIDGVNSVSLSTDGTNKEWFYRADLGNWMSITDLALTDVFPFPLEFEDFFVLGLAMRLNPRNGVTMDEQSVITFRRLRNMFRARYTQTTQESSEEGLCSLPSSSSSYRISPLGVK